MKFEVELPSLKGIARVEIKTVQEGKDWVAYLPLSSGNRLDDACMLLGQAGIPHRFTAQTEKGAEQAAKDFVKQNYHVVRMIW